MVFEYDNVVFYAHQVTLLNVKERKVYLSCGGYVQVDDSYFKKVRDGLTMKYGLPEVPQVVSETLQKPKNVKNKKQ
jgi:hypothetical protein